MSFINVTIGPASPPLTTAEGKTQLVIAASVTDFDDEIDDLIEEAAETVEKHLGLGLFTQTVVQKWDGFPGSSKPLELCPGKIQSINYLKYIDADGIEQELTQATKATGTLTFSGVPSDTETVTINSTVYTFQTTLTDVDGNVLIGATAEECARNITNAINLGKGAGVYYAASMTVNPDVRATYLEGVVTVTAILETTAPNAYATTETATNTAWTAATLSGGVIDDVDFKASLTRRPGIIVPAYSKSWPSTRNEIDTVYCEYVRGWSATADIPKPLKRAMKLMVSAWFECRDDGVRVLPTASEKLINRYREKWL